MTDPARPRGSHSGMIAAIVIISVFAAMGIANMVRLHRPAASQPPTSPAVPVETGVCTWRPLERNISQIGNILPMISVRVYARVAGKIIQRIAVEKGNRLNRGDAIAFLERDTIDAQLAEGRAGLAAARAGLRQVNANLDTLARDRQRMEYLFQEKAVARQTLDHIRAQHQALIEGRTLAQAQVEKANAILDQLQVLSDNHVVKAPATGVVAERHVDVGAMSVPTVPIVSIADEDRVKIVTSVTEKDMPAIYCGLPVRIRVDAFPDRRFDGTISIVGPTVDPMTRAAELEIHIANPDRLLKPGMFANIMLQLGQTTCLTVNQQALIRIPGTGSYFVYVVANGHAEMKNVTIGVHQGAWVEILSGLTDGQTVVIRGQNRLKDGMAVTIVNPAADQS